MLHKTKITDCGILKLWLHCEIGRGLSSFHVERCAYEACHLAQKSRQHICKHILWEPAWRTNVIIYMEYTDIFRSATTCKIIIYIYIFGYTGALLFEWTVQHWVSMPDERRYLRSPSSASKMHCWQQNHFLNLSLLSEGTFWVLHNTRKKNPRMKMSASALSFDYSE